MGTYIDLIKTAYATGKRENPDFNPMGQHLDGDDSFTRFKTAEQLIDYIEHHCGEESISEVKGSGLTRCLLIKSDENIGTWTRLQPIPNHKYVALFYRNTYYRFHGYVHRSVENTRYITIELVEPEEGEGTLGPLITDMRPGEAPLYNLEAAASIKNGAIITGAKLIALGFDTVTEAPI